MTNLYASLTRKSISDLVAYTAGTSIEEIQGRFGLSKIIKLASNENPLGISESVNEKLRSSLVDIYRYPDSSFVTLRHNLAQHLSCDSNQITFGNGSNELFELLIRTFAISKYDEIIISQYAFIVYEIIAAAAGIRTCVVPALNWHHDLDAMSASITDNTKIIFIASPNNPTGTVIRHQDFVSFMHKVRENVLVVVDEAYCEYLIQNSGSVSLLAQFSNLIITRTFSKIYALAGLRIGYSVSHPDIASLLNRVRQPFNVNALAAVAADAALADNDFVARSIKVNLKGKKQLEEAFERLGISYIKSQGNFITFYVQRASEVYTALLQRGVIVRPLVNYGMHDYLRVTIGLEEENNLFLTALEDIIAQYV